MTVEKEGNAYEGVINDISTMVDDSNGLFKIKADLAQADSVATGSLSLIHIFLGLIEAGRYTATAVHTQSVSYVILQEKLEEFKA